MLGITRIPLLEEIIFSFFCICLLWNCQSAPLCTSEKQRCANNNTYPCIAHLWHSWAQQFSQLFQYPQLLRSACGILEILYEMSNSEVLSGMKITGLGNRNLKTKSELCIYLGSTKMRLWTQFTCSFLQMHPSLCISN